MFTGAGRFQVDLSSAASAEPKAAELRETKICEWAACGLTFFRVKGSGTRFCNHCRQRQREKALVRRALNQIERGF